MDLVRGHAREEIIARVEFAHMLQAQPAPARPFMPAAIPFQRRRAEFARFPASRDRAGAVAFHAAMAAVEQMTWKILKQKF